MRLFLLLILIIFQGCNKDVSQNEEFKNVINKQFILQQDVFLADSDGVVTRKIYKPREGSYTPMTVDDFIDYPNDWWNSKEYKKYGENFGKYSYHIQNISIIKKNTVIRVVEVIKETNSDFNHQYLVGYIEDEEHKGVKINLTNLFERHYFDNPKWFSTEDHLLIEKP